MTAPAWPFVVRLRRAGRGRPTLWAAPPDGASKIGPFAYQATSERSSADRMTHIEAVRFVRIARDAWPDVEAVAVAGTVDLEALPGCSSATCDVLGPRPGGTSDPCRCLATLDPSLPQQLREVARVYLAILRGDSVC